VNAAHKGGDNSQENIMTSIDTPDTVVPASRCRIAATAKLVLAGSVLAVGAAFLTAPAAFAQSESGIKSDCTQGGRDYQTVVRADGTRISVCCPTGAPGELSAGKCSVWVNGSLSAIQAQPTNPRPVLPGRVATLPNLNQASVA
jgi:hypothetical protein